jgi:hypothetical protein
MASKLMNVRESQKAHWELKLSQRLEVLKMKVLAQQR